MNNVRFLAGLTLAALALSACSDTDPVGPAGPEPTALTVDAAADWTYVRFEGDEAVPVTVTAASESSDWDLGFFATSVMLNGGAAGPGEVSGHCLCWNATASDAEVRAMTAETETPAFESVTEAHVPVAAEAWQSDVLAPAIDGWYAYDPTSHVVSAAPENAWKVRSASGEAFAKFHVTGVEGATRSHAGTVTFELAVQSAAGEPFGATATRSVDLSSGSVYFDLETLAVVTAEADWDLLFEGYAIRLNGGVSGTGDAGAVVAGDPFEAIGDASDTPARVYKADAFGGVFDASPWYRYNLDGGHQVWPTFDVYLIRKGEAVYKIQLTGYYGPTGDSRQVTFRYARLR